MKILIYVRRETKEFYVNLVKKAYPNADVIIVSDFKNIGDIWFGNYIYQKLKTDQYFTSDISEDIYLRCRFLRSLDKDTGIMLINNLAFALRQFFVMNQIDVVVGGLIDNYTQDILERIAKEHNKPYISFVGHFFSGYCRISARGELHNMPRSVSKEEVETVLNQVMRESFKPGFKLNSPKSINYMRYFYWRELVKKHLYFRVKKVIDRDYLNYHYNTTLSNGWTFSSVIRKDINRYFNTLNELNGQSLENCVYMPLHFTPEATVDYWADNPKFALQDETIIKIAEETPSHIKLLIKEHPAMYLRRPIDFYESLLSLSNVTLIHPYEPSNSLLNKVENVLVFTGSVGVEALLRNKRVLTLTKNYYSNLHPNIFEVPKITDEALAKELQIYPQAQLVQDILQGMFKAKFYNDTTINNSDIDNIALNFKDYLEAINREKQENTVEG